MIVGNAISPTEDSNATGMSDSRVLTNGVAENSDLRLNYPNSREPYFWRTLMWFGFSLNMPLAVINLVDRVRKKKSGHFVKD